MRTGRTETARPTLRLVQHHGLFPLQSLVTGKNELRYALTGFQFEGFGCATRSPGFSSKDSFERFTSSTFSSPR